MRKYRARIYYLEANKALMWDRWQQCESLHAIARLFDRYHHSVRRILAETGGDRFGHSYLRNAPTVSSDQTPMMRDNLDLGTAGRPLDYLGARYWRIPPGYPPAQ